MVNTSLEITENEYLIKLNRNTFDLSFIRSLLKIVEISGSNEHTLPVEEHVFATEKTSKENDYYSHLDEK
jgi:hypothetical protein